MKCVCGVKLDNGKRPLWRVRGLGIPKKGGNLICKPKNFGQLENHSVIDVEYINGKTKAPKQSEIINNPIYDF